MQLSSEDSVLVKKEGSAGLHQTLLLSASFTSPKVANIYDTFDILYLFLIPRGLYFDNYDLMRKLKNVRVHSDQDYAPYEDLIIQNDSSIYRVFGIESVGVKAEAVCVEQWCFHNLQLPVHLTYMAAENVTADQKLSVQLKYPFVYLRKSQVGRGRASGYCARVSYLGKNESLPASCINCNEVLLHTFPQSIAFFPSHEVRFDYSDDLTRSDSGSVYHDLHHVAWPKGEPRPFLSFEFKAKRKYELRNVLSLTYFLLTLAAYLLFFFIVRVKYTRKSYTDKSL